MVAAYDGDGDVGNIWGGVLHILCRKQESLKQGGMLVPAVIMDPGSLSSKLLE